MVPSRYFLSTFSSYVPQYHELIFIFLVFCCFFFSIYRCTSTVSVAPISARLSIVKSIFFKIDNLLTLMQQQFANTRGKSQYFLTSKRMPVLKSRQLVRSKFLKILVSKSGRGSENWALPAHSSVLFEQLGSPDWLF